MMGGYNFTPRSPKQEPSTNKDSSDSYYIGCTSIDATNELEDFLEIEDEERVLSELKWDLMAWEEFPCQVLKEEDDDIKTGGSSGEYYDELVAKGESVGFWEEKDNLSLNLSLNYQEVIDAWSGRGSLWAEDSSISTINTCLVGGVTTIEEERERRRSRVLKYRKKRESRLFSKKIRYQVRKLNADKRPRLKGRFVKRTSPDKLMR